MSRPGTTAAAATPETALDILIVGGGPVGACVGTLLARTATRPLAVGVLEPSPQPAIAPDDTRIDARVSAFSRASERVFERTGAWQAIRPFANPYERMRVWHEHTAAHGDGGLVFDAADAGEANLGYVIENRRVTVALLRQFGLAGGQLIQAGFQSLTASASRIHVTTTSGTFTAKLVVGADGARSAVRTAAGMAVKADSYGQTAIVARIRGERPHQDSCWQRFLKAGTLAFLPLADGATSIVWSVSEDQARHLLALTPEDFTRELRLQSDDALGALTLDSERSAFPLQRLKARQYTSPRIALIGDAAHVVHPLAGQGVNLGLQDAAVLADLVAQASAGGEDPGAYGVLRAYERARKADNELMDAAIDGFNRFLAHGAGPVSQLARGGLRLVNRSTLLKRFFIEQALGS